MRVALRNFSFDKAWGSAAAVSTTLILRQRAAEPLVASRLTRAIAGVAERRREPPDGEQAMWGANTRSA